MGISIEVSKASHKSFEWLSMLPWVIVQTQLLHRLNPLETQTLVHQLVPWFLPRFTFLPESFLVCVKCFLFCFGFSITIKPPPSGVQTGMYRLQGYRCKISYAATNTEGSIHRSCYFVFHFWNNSPETSNSVIVQDLGDNVIQAEAISYGDGFLHVWICF